MDSCDIYVHGYGRILKLHGCTHRCVPARIHTHLNILTWHARACARKDGRTATPRSLLQPGRPLRLFFWTSRSMPTAISGGACAQTETYLKARPVETLSDATPRIRRSPLGHNYIVMAYVVMADATLGSVVAPRRSPPACSEIKKNLPQHTRLLQLWPARRCSGAANGGPQCTTRCGDAAVVRSLRP